MAVQAGFSLPRVTPRNHVSWFAGFGRAQQGKDPCTGQGLSRARPAAWSAIMDASANLPGVGPVSQRRMR